MSDTAGTVKKVLIFDDVVFARGETFNLPGLSVHVFENANDAAALADSLEADIIFMDFDMASDVDGAQATAALRAAGFGGTIVATSSDPARNAQMAAAGADDSLAKKAMLRAYLADLGARVDPS